MTRERDFSLFVPVFLSGDDDCGFCITGHDFDLADFAHQILIVLFKFHVLEVRKWWESVFSLVVVLQLICTNFIVPYDIYILSCDQHLYILFWSREYINVILYKKCENHKPETSMLRS